MSREGVFAESIQEKKKIILDILDQNDVETLEISFNGQGDDGTMYVESVKLKDGKYVGENHPACIALQEPCPQYNTQDGYEQENLHDSILDFCDKCLSAKDIDWVNGNGSDGIILFHVSKREVNMEYRISQYDDVSF
jgi:hypothetical protein